jgi:hypothetical protein
VKPDRWEKSAARENARRDAKAPLFAHAGLVDHTSAAEQKERVERVLSDMDERFAAHEERARRRIDIMRADLLALTDAATVQAFDTKRKWWPRTPEYELDGLTEEIAKARGQTKEEAFEAYRERPRVAEAVRVAADLRGLDGAEDEAAEEEAARAERKASASW